MTRAGLGGLRSRLRLDLRSVVIFTGPLVALVLYLFAAAALDYWRLQQFDDWHARSKHVDRLGFERVRSLFRYLRANEIDQRLSPEDETRPVLRLFVDQARFDAVGADVLGRWGEELEGQVEEQGVLQKVSLKLRGDTSVHWTTAKKSFALRADRGRMFKGRRELAFSAKDVLPAYLANSLPREFGIPCADTAIVPVFLNDRFYGLFRFTETLDESFLRKHTLLPGNIYRGDAAERGEYFKHQERELFKNLYIWDRSARNDRPGSTGTAALGEWLTALNGSTHAEFERAMSWLDRDELSRMLALMLACGDPFHMSGVHNQFWYEDPSSGLLHQIPWDIRLLDLERPPAGSNFNRALRTFLRDPRVFDGALAELARQIEGGKLLAAARRRLDEVQARFGDMLEFERLRQGWIPEVGDAEACLATLARNLDVVSRWIADARVAAHAERLTSDSAVLDLTLLDLEVRGFAACELVALRASGTELALYADSDLDGRLGDSDRRVPLARDGDVCVLAAPELLFPALDASRALLAPAPLAYRYFVVGSEGAVEPVLRNRHGGAPVQPSEWPAGSTIAAGTGWHPWLERSPAGRRVTLAGEVRLDETLVIERHSTLTIAPGTRLVLGPDVSLLAYGKVLANGTADAPITFVNALPQRPWGSLALQGAGADGSEFQHVTFRGGGGALLERVEYTGMVCVHNARNVYFRECRFESNLRCDDMLHADVADVFAIGCRFENANGDAIDYDMSGGAVRLCTIDRSANDGLDFMTCWPAVVGCTITNSGDKGISVGESSRPILFGNTIRDCNRGIEVKDGSEPVIAHTLIERCRTGIRARLKNWRYGYGGWPKLVNSIVADNASVFELDAKTHLTLHGSQVGASDDVQAPLDAAWLFQGFGLRVESDRLGPLDELEGTTPVPPLVQVEFEDDFGHPSDGWIRAGGVRRLDKRAQGLVATFKRAPGAFGTEVDWQLDEVGRRYLLALEVGTQDMLQAELVVTAADGREHVAPLDVGHDPARFQFARLELPAGRYRGLMLRGKPDDRPQSGASRVFLHRYVLVALAAEGR